MGVGEQVPNLIFFSISVALQGAISFLARAICADGVAMCTLFVYR